MLFKEKKLSTNFSGFLIIIVLLFVLLTVYFMSNYNRFGVYEFNFSNEIFSSSNGIAYFTPNKREITLSNILYLKDDNLQIKKMAIGIYYKNNDTYKEITSTYIDLGNESININDYLNTIVLNYEEKKGNKLNTNVELFFRENTYIKINITTTEDKELNYDIKVNASRLANNKLFY